MAETTFSYELENDKIFQAKINQAVKQVGNLKTPFKLISNDFYKSEQAIFKLKGPGQYPDFKSDKYKKRKQKKYGFSYPLLKATGTLANSVLKPNATGSINIIKPTSLTIGTSIPYGVFHQSDEPRKVIPLRKFLFIGPEAKKFATSEQMGRLQRWTDTIDKYVAKKLELLGDVT